MILIGFRRLYQAVGCSYTKPSKHAYDINGFRIQVGFGYEPLSPIPMFEFPRELVKTPDGKAQVPVKFWVANGVAGTPYAGMLLTDITCWKKYETEIDPSTVTKEGSKSQEAFIHATDVVSGILGLTLHRRILYRLLIEHWITRKDGTEEWSVPQPVEVMSLVEIDPDKPIGEDGDTIMADPKITEMSAMSWLVKAWSERDVTLRFLALFIPIEVILDGYVGEPPKPGEPSEQIRSLIQSHGRESATFLIDYFDGLLRPSLMHRFEAMAKEANFPDWEKDVHTFKKCNQLRNALLHRGKKVVTSTDIPDHPSEK